MMEKYNNFTVLLEDNNNHDMKQRNQHIQQHLEHRLINMHQRTNHCSRVTATLASERFAVEECSVDEAKYNIVQQVPKSTRKLRQRRGS